MKVDALAHDFSVSQASAKGACPICSVLKKFQSALAERIQIASVSITRTSLSSTRH
jgi:hypothetical protein